MRISVFIIEPLPYLKVSRLKCKSDYTYPALRRSKLSIRGNYGSDRIFDETNNPSLRRAPCCDSRPRQREPSVAWCEYSRELKNIDLHQRWLEHPLPLHVRLQVISRSQ